MKRVIVTGADGFIGRYVLERLIEEGYYAYAISRHKQKYESPAITNLCLDLANIVENYVPLHGLAPATSLIHLAADIRVPGSAESFGNNTFCLLSAIKVAVQMKVRHFVYLSSLPVIGEILYTPIDERHPVCPKTPYHWSKYLGEIILEQFAESFETITVLRIPSPLGIGMRRHVFLPLMLERMTRGEEVEIYGEGGRIQNYLDVRDIAEGILQVMEKRPQGLYLLSGVSISNWELAVLCQKITGTNSVLVRGRHADEVEKEKWIVSSAKARIEWGFAPRRGLDATVRWIYEGLK